MPELSAALKIFTAAGATAAAGTVAGNETPFVAFVQAMPEVQPDVAPVTADAVVASVSLPLVNVVDLIVTFQPAAVPLGSVTTKGSVWVGVWSVPFRVTETEGVADELSARLPPLMFAVAVTFA